MPGGGLEPRSALGRPVAAPRVPVPGFVEEVNRLYREAGKPSYRHMEELISRNDEALSRSTIGRMLKGQDNPRWSRWDSLIRCLAQQSIYIRHDPDALIKRLHALYLGSEAPVTNSCDAASRRPLESADRSAAVLDAESEKAVAAAWRAAQAEIAMAKAAAAEREAQSADPGEDIQESSTLPAFTDTSLDHKLLVPPQLPWRKRLFLVMFLYSACGLLTGGVVGALVSSRLPGSWAGPAAGITVGLFTGEAMGGLTPPQRSQPATVRRRIPGLMQLGAVVGLASGVLVGGVGATHLVDGLLLGCTGGIGIGGLLGGVVLADLALHGPGPAQGTQPPTLQGTTSDALGSWKPAEGKPQS